MLCKTPGKPLDDVNNNAVQYLLLYMIGLEEAKEGEKRERRRNVHAHRKTPRQQARQPSEPNMITYGVSTLHVNVPSFLQYQEQLAWDHKGSINIPGDHGLKITFPTSHECLMLINIRRVFSLPNHPRTIPCKV